MALITALPPDHREIIREKYVLAVDIGQSSDPTAVAAIHHTHFQHMHPNGNVRDAGETFDVRHLARCRSACPTWTKSVPCVCCTLAHRSKAANW